MTTVHIPDGVQAKGKVVVPSVGRLKPQAPRDRHKWQLPMPPAGPRTAGGEGEEEDIEHVKAS